MKFKTITIKDEAYRDLLSIKRKDESFSELFKRLTKKEKPDLMKFAGAWKMSDEEFKKVKTSIKDYRKAFNKSFRERLKRYGIR